MPVFHIDDQPVEFYPGEKILSAALRNGEKIPHYCYHPGMSIVATCRMCLVDIAVSYTHLTLPTIYSV